MDNASILIMEWRMGEQQQHHTHLKVSAVVNREEEEHPPGCVSSVERLVEGQDVESTRVPLLLHSTHLEGRRREGRKQAMEKINTNRVDGLVTSHILLGCPARSQFQQKLLSDCKPDLSAVSI